MTQINALPATTAQTAAANRRWFLARIVELAQGASAAMTPLPRRPRSATLDELEAYEAELAAANAHNAGPRADYAEARAIAAEHLPEGIWVKVEFDGEDYALRASPRRLRDGETELRIKVRPWQPGYDAAQAAADAASAANAALNPYSLPLP